MSDLNDKELFESAITDAPVTEEAPQETPAEQTEQAGQPRDEQGRFAAKAEEQAQEQAQQTEQPARDEAHVPSWRLREVNEAREAAERRAQEQELNLRNLQSQFQALQRQLEDKAKPKEEPVDFFTDPNAALSQRLSPVEQRMQAIEMKANLRASKAEAIAIHGKDAVSEMETALDKAMVAGHPGIPALRMQMLQSDDPVGIAMQWHQRERLLQETGGDLGAYKNKTLEDALKDPAFLAKALEAARSQAGQATAQGKPIVQIPPSINRATSAASPHDDPGDMSDRSLYASATR